MDSNHDRVDSIHAVNHQQYGDDELVYTIIPDSWPFITGIAPSYSEEYNERKLRDFLTKKEFKNGIKQINNTLISNWPCPLCYYGCGLILGIFTLGLTWILPYICIRDAHDQMLNTIERINEKHYVQHGVYLKYTHRFWYRSRLEIRTLPQGAITRLQLADARV